MVKSNSPSSSAVTFVTFGEETDVPIDITRAAISAPELVPHLGKCLAWLELTAVNNTVNTNVTGKLRISLPLETTVVGFEFLRPESDGTERWYPASAVPKKKAKEVVYQEKERGREVAVTSDVAEGSNVFEIDVFPLPYKKGVKCRLECIVDHDLCELEALVEGIAPTEINGTTEHITSTVTGMSNETESQIETENLGAAAVLGDCFGKTHFVCRIPSKMTGIQDGGVVANDIKHIAILWDESSSEGQGNKDTVTKRYERLRELSSKHRELRENTDGKMTFELHTFGVGLPSYKGDFDDVDELFSTIKDIEYDGGTDVTTLSDLLLGFVGRHQKESSALVAETSKKNVDAVLIFTDGMDNLGRVPDFSELPSFGSFNFPVHCVADGKDANMKCLRHIAAASSRFPGVIFTSKDTSYVQGVLFPQPVLYSVKTDQSEDAFLQEVDDGFRCIPDHRLGRLCQPMPSDGILMAGILGDEGVCDVSTIVAEVLLGNGEVHEHHFHLRQKETGDLIPSSETSHTTRVYHHRAKQLASTTQGAPNHQLLDPARLVGHLYAGELYKEAESVGLKSGMDVTQIKEDLSLRYGFCSPEASLLMLYTADQFLDNDILPQQGHPVYNDPEVTKKRQELEREKEDDLKRQGQHQGTNVRDIGSLKDERRRQKVSDLAKILEAYMKSPVARPSPPPRVSRVVLRGACGSMAGSLAVHPGDTALSACEDAPRRLGGSFLQSMRRTMARSGRGSNRSRGRGIGQTMPCRESSTVSRSQQIEETRRMMQDNISSMLANCEQSADIPDDYRPRACFAEVRDDYAARYAERCAPEEAPAPELAPASAMADDCFEPPSDSLCMLGQEYAQPAQEFLSHAAAGNLGPGLCSSRGLPVASGDEPIITPARDPNEFAQQLKECLDVASAEPAWKEKYFQLRNDKGCHNSNSPSFFLSCARVLLEYNKAPDAIRIATNCLEMKIENVQMLRSVGYFLLSTKNGYGSELALAVFDRIKELCPLEPQSFLDCALVRFWELSKITKALRPGKMPCKGSSDVSSEVRECQELISHVLLHQWADRFDEIEWPALILLHYVYHLAKKMNRVFGKDTIPEWPCKQLLVFETKTPPKKDSKPLWCPKFELALMVWLGWDTDKTDIDLHVVEPNNNEVFYQNPRSPIGGRLSRDFTQGYGPEVYILKDPREGKFDIFAKYFASHQDSALTGTTSAVLWTMKKCDNGENEIEFHNTRLGTNKEKTKVAVVSL